MARLGWGLLPAGISWAALTLFALDGCIIAGDKCGPHQIELGDFHTLCACEPGAVIDANQRGCVKCGDNQEAQNGVCVCKPGFARASEGAECEKADIGLACSDQSICEAPYPYCVRDAEVEAGYCTANDCTANADCPVSWSCETADEIRYCRKPPSGLGSSCQSDVDCEEFEASYCETFQSRTCVLAGCADSDVTCPSEWTCCDFSALLGSKLSLCLTGAQAIDGACPAGGKRVTE